MGWHWLTKLHRSAMYNGMMYHLYIALWFHFCFVQENCWHNYHICHCWFFIDLKPQPVLIETDSLWNTAFSLSQSACKCRSKMSTLSLIAVARTLQFRFWFPSRATLLEVVLQGVLSFFFFLKHITFGWPTQLTIKKKTKTKHLPFQSS